MRLEDLKNLSAALEYLPEWIVTTNDNGETHYLRYSHESLFLGYVKKKSNLWLETEYYKGRFGEGLTIKCNNPNSTRYCYKVYFIEKSKEDYARYLINAYGEMDDYCSTNENCMGCFFHRDYECLLGRSL